LPLISVIIPVYNAAGTILETLDSVSRQTFPDFEILVIDDGSTDETVSRLGQVHDGRMRLASFPNGGLAEARNRGIREARGEFLSFIDADDLWTPEKLESQLTALRSHPEAGIAYSWTVFIDQQGRFLFAKEPMFFEGDVSAHLLKSCFIASGSNVLIRRRCVESVGSFDVGLKAAEDWDYWLRAAERWPFVVVPRYHVFYRLSVYAMSSDIETIEAASRTVLERALARAPAQAKHLRAECVANLRQYLAFLCLARATRPDSRAAAGARLWDSIRLCPRLLFRCKTHCLLWVWLFIHLLPRSLSFRAVRGVLRFYGWLMMLVTPRLWTRAIFGRI
jgi:glycosyltransferase involved in cell wall biosynthesis